MRKLDLLKSIFRKRSPEVSGISILFLQKKLERFTDDQLSQAMQRAWRKPYDSTKFFGISMFDGEGGLLKYNAMFFTMQHFDRRVDAAVLSDAEMPSWASHNAYTLFGYSCPGGIPEGETRDKLNYLLGLFCIELLGENTQALLFREEGVVLRYDLWLQQELRSRKGWDPRQLFAAQAELSS
jgi:hypothetical protein